MTDKKEADMDDARTDEERDDDDRRDYLESLQGRQEEPLCPTCGVPMANIDQRAGEPWCYWCSAGESAEFDESPIAGKPDDFYDRGHEEHPDVW